MHFLVLLTCLRHGFVLDLTLVSCCPWSSALADGFCLLLLCSLPEHHTSFPSLNIVNADGGSSDVVSKFATFLMTFLSLSGATDAKCAAPPALFVKCHALVFIRAVLLV